MEIQLLNIKAINCILEQLEEHEAFLCYKIKEDLKRYNTLLRKIKKDSEEIFCLYQVATEELKNHSEEEKIDQIGDLLMVTEEAHIQSLVLLRGVAERLENLTLLKIPSCNHST